ncbi:hypothetical protein Aperf_G00000064961 [Anoplocephala perfoliata]
MLFYQGGQRKPRNDISTLSSGSGSVKYKWRRKHMKTNKKSDPEVLTTSIELNSESSSTSLPCEFYPGMVRVPATDSCAVCANDVEYVYVLSKCGHPACIDCWRRFASSQVSSFALAHITCIACDRRLSRVLTIQLLKPRPPADTTSNSEARHIFEQNQATAEKIYQRYEDFLLRQCLARDKHTRWCPRGCGYAVLAGSRLRSCPRIECKNPGCKCSAFCYKCQGAWGPDDREHVCKGSADRITSNNVESGSNSGSSGELFPENHQSILSRLQRLLRLPTADATGSQRKPEDIESGGSDSSNIAGQNFSTTAMPVQARAPLEVSTDDEIEETVPSDKGSDADISKMKLDIQGEVKPCPRCKTLLLKVDDGSCNHMNCFICGCEFCWLCLREVRDTHFLSPTGCTFWGRKRWPFRRRLFSMLIAAFGTPLILAIVTALAIPGITIGFPAYVAYKTGQHVTGKKWKRILLKTLSFFGGLLVSPIIAALVALFGIPLVLIYVYIFMPITLFSELKVRLSSNDPPSAVKTVDPDVGFKINWNLVGEAAASAAENAEHIQGPGFASSSSKQNSARCSPTASSPFAKCHQEESESKN